MNHKKNYFLLLLFICCGIGLNAQLNLQQATFSHSGIVDDIGNATLQANESLYLPIQVLLKQYKVKLPVGLTESNLHTLQKITEMHLQNDVNDATNKLVQPLQQTFYLEKAKTFFKNKMYKEAIEMYNKVDNATLTNLQIVEKNFNLAYSYLNTNQEKEVMPLMASLVNIKGDYFQSGNYYYGMLQFYNGNYDNALTSFLKIKNDRQYKKVVPYYLTALYYFKGQKDTALQYAEAKLNDDKTNMYFREELNLLVGQINFEKKNYDKAIPYIENYIADAAAIRREDLFLLGFSHYQIGNIAKAINVLNRVAEDLDTISQMTNYVLGDCYLKQGNKADAKDAFQKVLNIDGINIINEISRYHFASLSYELNIDDDALNATYNLLQKFPNTPYKEDCLKMIGNLLTSTKNYEGALKVIREFKENNQIKTAYQKIAFNQAMLLLKNGYKDKALELLLESDKNGNDEGIKSFSDFWKSEIYYQQKLYELSNQYATAFINNTKEQQGDANWNNAYLIKTYIAIKKGEDTLATTNLNKIFASKNDTYLLANATELNKINSLLESIKNKEKNINDNIKLVEILVDNNAADAQKNLMLLDSIQQPKPYQVLKINELKLIQQVNTGNFDKAFSQLQQINNPTYRIQYFKMLCAIALQNTEEINRLAKQNATTIDTTNEWQAKIIVQSFDYYLEKLNIAEANNYYILLSQFKSLPYAKVRLPIKAKMLKTAIVNQSKLQSIPTNTVEQKRNGSVLEDSLGRKNRLNSEMKKEIIVPIDTVLPVKKGMLKKIEIKNVEPKAKIIDSKKNRKTTK
jgi:Anaphase-promoting complex, cyclosome, subunit 3